MVSCTKKSNSTKGKRKRQHHSVGIGTKGKCASKKKVLENVNYLHALLKGLTNKAQKDALVDNITNGQMTCIKQMINSFLQGKIQLGEKDLKKLKRDKKYLYSIISPKTNDTIKKKVIKMKGGGLLLPLLGAIAPGIIEPVAKTLTKGVIAPVINEFGKMFKR